MTGACCQASISVSSVDIVGQTCPAEYGPAKTLYNRYKRWSEAGVFEHIFNTLACDEADLSTLMIHASHIKTHRIAANGVKKKTAQDAPLAKPKAG